jgi:HK97 family phage prohead protease
MPNTSIELTEYKAVQGQVNVDEAQGVVEAFVAGIGNKDSVGDIIVTGAFNDSLKRRKPRVVWGHNWNEPIGKVLEIYEVPKNDPRLPAKMKAAGIGGVYARVQFNLKSERGRQAFSDVAFFGEEQEWSIGYKTLDADFDPQMQANILKKVELYEVSPVLHGANQLTGTISIKADQPLKDPKGGLTAAGRRHFARTEGANLKPGVMGAADTPEKMRRKGSFLTRFFTNPSGPMKDEDGEPTRLALSAAAWGEPVPQNMEDAAALASKGRRMLERYKGSKKKGKSIEFSDMETKAHDAMISDPSFKRDMQQFVYDELRSKGMEPTPKAMDRSMLERMVRTRAMEQFKKQRMMAMMRALMQQAQENAERGENEEDDDEGIPAKNPAMGRAANLAAALAEKYGGAVRIRESDANQVVFDHRGMQGESTMRVSYHYEDGKFMIGDATEVKPKLVYISMNGDQMPSTDANERRFVDRYNMDEDPQIPAGVKPKTPEKADPLGGLVPQEIATARTRGYGPRRGNLEQLLRYWRPIMRKPGGFRRCRVILANHPELYPLNNICAWLHHETTGLWPNEGCHHPGMKNCRKKMRGVMRGSIWSDSEWNDRLRSLASRGGQKDDGSFDMDDVIEVFGDMGTEEKNMMLMEDIGERLAVGTLPDYETDNEDDANKQAYEALREFMNAEPDFISRMTGDDNWEMEGEDDDGMTIVMPLMSKPGGGCGCGGGCGGGGREMIAALAAALADMVKELEDDVEVKAGRTISTRNMQKLRQAYSLLEEVLTSGGGLVEMEAKSDFLVESDIQSVYAVKQMLDPVLSYWDIQAEATEFGVKIFDIGGIDNDAYEALMNVVATIDNI